MLWTTIPAGMVRAGLGVGDDRPISYLGTDPRGVVLFRVGLLVAALGFSIFALAIGRRLVRPASFLVVFLAGQACQVIVAVVSIDGPNQRVHTTAGIALGLSLPLLLWRYAAAQPPGRWRRHSYSLLGLEVGGCIVGVTLSALGLAVIAEVAPALAFHLWVIVVALRWPAWAGSGVQAPP